MSDTKQKPQNDHLPMMVLYGTGAAFLYWLWISLCTFCKHYYAQHPWVSWIIVGSLLLLTILGVVTYVWNRIAKRVNEKAFLQPDKTSVYLGESPEVGPVHLKQTYRMTHTQVIGTTSAGKTESVILPWAIRDIELGNGLLIIDGKSDKSFLEKFYAYTVKNNREKDFRLFSLASPNQSSAYNPLLGGTAYEICERVFSAFDIENEYYRGVQYNVFRQMIELILGNNKVPTFALIKQLISNPAALQKELALCQDDNRKIELAAFLKDDENTRLEKISGLESNISHFCSKELSPLFNAINTANPYVRPQIQFDEALSKNHICYFQLPSMLYPKLASATGKLVLQAFQSAVSRRHVGLNGSRGFFACYLDDFQDYIYEGFGALLNKSRSANVGVVFSHQSLGDLEKVSPAFRDVVLTNTNVKCVMRSNDPNTCEYFSKSFGTKTGEKSTERAQKTFFGRKKTGDGSVREAEEFIIHPNRIRHLGTGQGIVTIPHFGGIKTLEVKFRMRPSIEPVQLPELIETIPEAPKMVQSVVRVETGAS